MHLIDMKATVTSGKCVQEITYIQSMIIPVKQRYRMTVFKTIHSSHALNKLISHMSKLWTSGVEE